MFEKLQAVMERSLIPVSNKLAANKILKAISGGFAMLMPVIMAGAIGSLLSGLSFEFYQNFITSVGLKPLFSMVTEYTTNMMALYAVFAIGYAMANQLECAKVNVQAGLMSLMAFLSMLYTSANLENVAAYAAGEPLPNMITQTWWFIQAQLGGSGAAIGLAFCMVLLAKSQRYKTLGKLAIAPAVCSISEPMVFGFPLVLNPVMLIPMLVSPLVCFSLSYILTAVGILPYLNGVGVPTGTPIILSGLIGGGWRTAVWQVVLVCIQFGIYLPFFKMMDKQAVAEENAETASV